MTFTRIGRLAIICLGLSASGCATVTTGTSQSVSVVTEKGVEGARCELTDSKDGKWFVSNSPGTVTVRKGDGPMTVICKKEGFNSATTMVEESFVGATLGNVILGGGIGIIIDAASGAAQQYPDQIVVWMRPEEWESEAQRKEWEQAKLAYDKAQERETQGGNGSDE